MKKTYFLTLMYFAFLGISFNLFSQGNMHSLTRENISLNMPDGWLATKLGKKFGDFGIKLSKQNDVAFVEINCTRRVLDPTGKITTLASERSNKETFAYMQIDEVQDSKLSGLKAKRLVYTNTYLIDTYRGGIYGLVDNGYTYTIEYYGADTPEQRSEIEKILSSIKIDKPFAQDNIVEISDGFVPSDWNVVPEEETEEQKAEAQKKIEKKSVKEAKKLSKEEKKLAKEQEKRLKEETKKVEKKKKDLEKKKKQKVKDDKRAAEKKKKAMKAKKDDSELKEALQEKQ
jgi:hypothetical protein